MLGCSALAQTKYLARNNALLKILFLEVVKVYNLVETIPPWFSPAQPKSVYLLTAYWGPSLHGSDEVRTNRVDTRFVDRGSKTFMLLEMSCPWIENKKWKEEEKTIKYVPLWLDLQERSTSI